MLSRCCSNYVTIGVRLASVLCAVVRLWSGYCGPSGVSLQIRDNRNKFSTQHVNPRVANVHVNPSQSKFVTRWLTSMGMSSLPPLRSSPRCYLNLFVYRSMSITDTIRYTVDDLDLSSLPVLFILSLLQTKAKAFLLTTYT